MNSTTIEIIQSVFMAILIAGVVVVLIVLFWRARYDSGYKEGQIDAINGIQKYKLVEFPDGTREYYEDPKPEDFTDENKNFKIIKP